MTIERVTVTGQYYGGVTMQNVLHFNNADGFLSPNAVCIEIRDNWLQQIKTNQSNIIHWLDVACQTLGSAASPTHLAIDVQGADSVAANQSLSFVCWKLQINTGVAGRSGRGRIYVSGLRNTHFTSGAVGSTGLTALATPVANLNARYKSGGSGPLVIGVMPRGSTVSADFKSCTSLTIASIAGVQRRRNIGVGI